MGVIVQRHGDVGMAHDVLQSLRVHTGVCHTGLQERVPEGVWGDIGQWLLCCLLYFFKGSLSYCYSPYPLSAFHPF